MKPKLYYVYDPMCSWCWGFAPTWQKLQEALVEVVDVEYCLGGLAEDSDIIMTEDMQLFLQQTWRKISEQLGTQFNFNFWQLCQPKRSTYPACRAMLLAREQNKEHEMLAAIQHAYYLHAKNPSEPDVLCQLAANVGLDISHFFELIKSKVLHQQLTEEIAKARAMPIQGFPSLVLYSNNCYHAIPIDYKSCQINVDLIMKLLKRHRSLF